MHFPISLILPVLSPPPAVDVSGQKLTFTSSSTCRMATLWRCTKNKSAAADCHLLSHEETVMTALQLALLLLVGPFLLALDRAHHQFSPTWKAAQAAKVAKQVSSGMERVARFTFGFAAKGVSDHTAYGVSLRSLHGASCLMILCKLLTPLAVGA